MIGLALRTAQLLCIFSTFLFHKRGSTLDQQLRRTQWYARCLLRTLGIRAHYHGTPPTSQQSCLCVVNHLSYIDPLLLNTLVPMRFITSLDTGGQGFLGRVCTQAGCLFINRRSRLTVRDETRVLSKHLSDGPLALFPEGTTSNGQDVLPFKSSLLACAVETQCPVIPVCVRYRQNPQRYRQLCAPVHIREQICWYGTMAFFPHVVRLLLIGRAEADVFFLPPMPLQVCRKKMAIDAHRIIQQHYCMP